MKPMSDIIELSDHFRRSVVFENHEAVAQIVAQAHKFACEVTWIDLTYPPENQINRTTIANQKAILQDMVSAAEDAGLKNIILPLPKDCPFAQFVQAEVLDKNDFTMKITFRSSEYRKDLAGVGAIDPAVKTALDEGVRGVCAVDPDMRYKWDSDMRPAGS